MKYQKLNLKNWNRIKQFEFFKKYENPFFNICSTLDVTELLLTTKRTNSHFSTNLLYSSIHMANKFEEFRYRLSEDEVIICDSIYAGSTVLNDDKTFSFCYFDYYSDFKKFNMNAKKQLDLVKKGLLEFDGRNNDLDIIHYSIIPWISFTSFSHPRNYGTNDSIPKIVFGKYYQEKDHFKIPISIEVHHALMDGYHLGQYLYHLQAFLDKPDFIC